MKLSLRFIWEPIAWICLFWDQALSMQNSYSSPFAPTGGVLHHGAAHSHPSVAMPLGSRQGLNPSSYEHLRCFMFCSLGINSEKHDCPETSICGDLVQTSFLPVFANLWWMKSSNRRSWQYIVSCTSPTSPTSELTQWITMNQSQDFGWGQLPPAMQQVVQTVLSGLAFNNGHLPGKRAPNGKSLLKESRLPTIIFQGLC